MIGFDQKVLQNLYGVIPFCVGGGLAQTSDPPNPLVDADCVTPAAFPKGGYSFYLRDGTPCKSQVISS